MEHQKNFDKDPKEKEFVEKLVTLNRTCKTVKGGRRMSFSALTVVDTDLVKLTTYLKLLRRVLIVQREILL